MLHRAAKQTVSASSILELSEGRGRKQRLAKDEETLIVDSILYFHNNATPLDTKCIMDLVQTLVQSFSDSRQKMIGFKDDRPGRDWLRNFLKRHTKISLRRRIGLDKYRCMAMNPQNVAKHFCRL